MAFLAGIFKQYLRISSLDTMLIVLGIGVAMSHLRPTSSWGRRWLTASVLAYWVASTPFGSWIIAAPVMRTGRIESRQQAEGAQAVVVLGGGIRSYLADGLAVDDLQSSALRVIETARVYKLLENPFVIVSGGPTQQIEPLRAEAIPLRDAMITLGVPASRVLVEDRSMTTRDEAVLVKAILNERHIDRFVLVTSPVHMGRSLASFRSVGLTPIPSASASWSEQPRRSWWEPQGDLLGLSDEAVYEYLAWLYYWYRGWV